MVYEIVLGIGGIDAPFSIYTMRPRRHLNKDSKISEIVSISQILVVEVDEAAIDPITFLSNVSESATQLQTVCDL